ncbi:serine protease family S33 [Thraustotheca clavata]|uniref:Serine protease family S33 n=1 Tax=Thraustotheca clavata TaxID=74557 RepID=A0A1V9Y796_9STRA|nr:serine protease family S33 [Thraustotheca clavata]
MTDIFDYDACLRHHGHVRLPLFCVNGLILCRFKTLAWLAGFSEHYVQVDGIEWSYLDTCNGDKEMPIVVYLHGFSSVKNSMLRVARPVSYDFRVIIPDIPGHGNTKAPNVTSYRATEQATRLDAFLNKVIGTRKIHLIGCSMGGMIAGTYASMFPDRIDTVTLICPAGLSMPKRSELLQIFEDTGENYMRATTGDEFLRLHKYMFHAPRNIPRWLANVVANERAKQGETLEQLMSDILLDFQSLDDKIDRIQSPCHVIWGDDDKILSNSSIELIRKAIPEHKLTVNLVPNAGHCVHQEKHAEVATLVLEYLHQVITISVPE